MRLRSGFTLMEIILVIGIIAIISAIVIAAINPSNQLEQANDTKRRSAVREIDNAISQYVIDGNTLTGIPTTIATAEDICQDTTTGTDCTVTAGGFDLSGMVPTYLVNIPIDPAQTGSTLSGYRLYQQGSFIRVCNQNLDATCGP